MEPRTQRGRYPIPAPTFAISQLAGPGPSPSVQKAPGAGQCPLSTTARASGSRQAGGSPAPPGGRAGTARGGPRLRGPLGLGARPAREWGLRASKQAFYVPGQAVSFRGRWGNRRGVQSARLDSHFPLVLQACSLTRTNAIQLCAGRKEGKRLQHKWNSVFLPKYGTTS